MNTHARTCTIPLTANQAEWLEQIGFFQAGGTEYAGVQFGRHEILNSSSRQIEWVDEEHPLIQRARRSA